MNKTSWYNQLDDFGVIRFVKLGDVFELTINDLQNKVTQVKPINEPTMNEYIMNVLQSQINK